jgi:hypothetical protein
MAAWKGGNKVALMVASMVFGQVVLRDYYLVLKMD